jgi:hypothetical protein
MTPAENRVLDIVAVQKDRAQSSSGFPFKTFDEMSLEAPTKRHLIKGIIARGESSAWIAPPGGMKSALMASAAISISSAQDWFGFRNKEAAAVVYFAFERADLVRRRLQAQGQRQNLKGLPIAVVNSPFDLTKPDSFKRVVDTIRDIERHFDCSVGLGIFDTFAKLISNGGGDENSARDQGLVFASLQRVKNNADIHVAIVGHTGKDEARGMRGSNAALGDVDVMVTISGDEVRTATVTKANDASEGPLFSFKSEIHSFGTDEDGDPITVNIVGDAVVEQSSGKNRKDRKKLPNAALICQRALHEAIIESGVAAPPVAQIPAGRRVVPIKEWRRLAYSRGISGSSEERAREQAFKRSMETLVAVQAVGVWDDLAWCVQ